MAKVSIWEAGLPLAVLPAEASRPAQAGDGRPCATCGLDSLAVTGNVWGHPSRFPLPHVASESRFPPVTHLLCSCQAASPHSPIAFDLLVSLPSLGTHSSHSGCALDPIEGSFLNLSAHSLLKAQIQTIS